MRGNEGNQDVFWTIYSYVLLRSILQGALSQLLSLMRGKEDVSCAATKMNFDLSIPIVAVVSVLAECKEDVFRSIYSYVQYCVGVCGLRSMPPR